MARRPRAEGDVLDSALVATVIAELETFRSKAQIAAVVDELEDLEEDAELQGLFAAFFCPAVDIVNEGEGALDLIATWGVPKAAVERLKSLFGSKMKDDGDLREARSALYALFTERDSWSDYIDDYEDTVQRYTNRLFAGVLILPVLAIVVLYFATRFSPLLLLGFLLAGGAGSCVSLISKTPALEMSLFGELDAYGRRVLSRVAIGLIASFVGCAGLAWVPLSIQNQTFADAITACTTAACVGSSPVSCTTIKLLILLGVPMLLGYSERTLPSFEKRVFGEGAIRRPRTSRKG